MIALGTTNAIPRAIKQQNWTLLMQMVSANPLAAGLVNQVAFWRETFQLFDVKNVDEFMEVPPEQQQAMAQLAQMGAFGKGPGGAGAVGGGNQSNSPAEMGDANTLSPTGGLEGINASL